MNYFVVSDVHSHYTELKEALSKAGFIENDSTMQLILNGDVFDRGTEAEALYKWIRSLTNVTHLLGNHEMMLLQFLIDPKNPINKTNVYYNGLHSTLESLGHVAEDELMEYLTHDPIALSTKIVRNHPTIIDYLSSLKPYLETETHIIVHAGFRSEVGFDWRMSNFQEFCWNKEFMYRDTTHIDKTIVLGHVHAIVVRLLLREEGLIPDGAKGDYSILEYGNKVFIDGGIYQEGGQINVYSFEE